MKHKFFILIPTPITENTIPYIVNTTDWDLSDEELYLNVGEQFKQKGKGE